MYASVINMHRSISVYINYTLSAELLVLVMVKVIFKKHNNFGVGRGGVCFYLLANKKFQVHSKTCSGTLVKQVALRVCRGGGGGGGGRKHLKHFFSSKCVGLSNHLHMWGLPAAGDLEYFAGFTVAFKALPSRTV